MTAVPRAVLVGVYDTILQSQFVPRTQSFIEPLGRARNSSPLARTVRRLWQA